MALFIGLTGPPGSGKSSVIEIISTLCRERGVNVRSYSLSDEIRKEAKRREIDLRRDSLKQTADLFRNRTWRGVWAVLVASKAKEYLAKMEDDTDATWLVLIDAIRNPGEVRELRTQFGNQFKLLGITASPEVISDNLRRRNRSDESERVLEDERALQNLIESEMGLGEPGFGHNVASCVAMSDWPVIENSGSLAELEAKVRALADLQILPLLTRPRPSHSALVNNAMPAYGSRAHSDETDQI